MTITTITEKISDIIDNMDELTHLDSADVADMKLQLENIQDRLCELADDYGDDPCERPFYGEESDGGQGEYDD